MIRANQEQIYGKLQVFKAHLVAAQPSTILQVAKVIGHMRTWLQDGETSVLAPDKLEGAVDRDIPKNA
jgi:hypothetical protein